MDYIELNLLEMLDTYGEDKLQSILSSFMYFFLCFFLLFFLNCKLKPRQPLMDSPQNTCDSEGQQSFIAKIDHVSSQNATAKRTSIGAVFSA